jgi:predicted MFS family arabinose efflux permease
MNTSAKRGVGSALAILFLVNLLAAVDRTALAAVLPAIKSDLVLSDTQLGFLTGIAFSAFYAVFGLPLASWADRRNRRTILCFSVLFWSIATAATGMARGFSQLAGARMLVAVGEAGGVPAAHSLLSELTPVTRRPMVFAVHSAAAPLGALVGLAGVGILADLYGWRTSFFVLGLAGLPVLAMIVAWLPEPRQISNPPTDSALATWSGLLGNRSFLWLLAGFAFGSFAMAGLLQWLPSYFGRTFRLSLGEAGVLFGLAYGAGAVAGMLLGGICANRLMSKRTVWALWIASLSYVLGAPLLVAALIVDSLSLSLTLVALGTGVASAAYGPAFAMIQTIAEPRMRAKASAISLFVSNLVGAGLGPLFVGILSDAIGGENSLQTAMLWLSPALFVPAICYWRSATAFDLATSTSGEAGQ